MKLKYCIADLIICLESDFELIENSESALFKIQSLESEGLYCHVNLVEELPKAEGRFIGQALDTRLYQSETEICLETFNREDDQPMIVSYFSKDRLKNVEVWSLDEKLPHTARIQALWSAIDLPYQLLKADILTLHSSVIEIGGKAILFLAASGVGKSTQARLWHEFRDAKQLNGDKAAISCKEGVTMAYGLPFCGTSHICTNYKLPVRAMVLLSQAEENTITRLNGIVALKALMDNCFGHRAIEGCMEKMLRIIGEVLNNTPVYALACTLDERAVNKLEEQLRKDKIYGNFLFSVD